MNAALNPPPRLTLVRAGSQITISWPGEGFVLQENANVANPAGWTDAAGGAASPVTVTVPASGMKFYRLRQQ